jgi:hypothetical protein
MGEDLNMPEFIHYVYAVLLIAASISVVLNLIAVPCMLGGLGIKSLDDILNPSAIYRRGKVNKFGTILATIFHNIFLFPHAIWFWIYKACTVGT